MYELEVRGEMKCLGWKEGSSGVFDGTIKGLYQGYRFASAAPDEQEFFLPLQYGGLAFVLHQEFMQEPTMALPPRPAVNPFADGQDPTADAGPPPELPPGAPPPRGPATDVVVRVDPDKSTGIFAGATGEMSISAPNYQTAGYLIVETGQGTLRMDFLEHGSVGGVLLGELWVNGALSTGMWHGATGALRSRLQLGYPNTARGEYEGTISLAAKPEG